MPKIPGLVRQGASFSYRRRVPGSLLATIGKREVWVALSTGEYKIAVGRAREASVATDRLFSRARTALRNGEPFAAGDAHAISEAELQRVSQRAFWKREREAGRGLALPAGIGRAEWAEELETELAALEGQEPGALAQMAARAQQVVKSEGMKIDAPKPGQALQPALSRLIELLRRAEMEGLRRDLARLDGGHGDAAHDPLFADISSLSGPAEVAAAKPITLREAIDRFGSDPTRAHLGDTADAKYIVTFRAMREVIGDDRPLAAITRAECASVQELVAGLPANVAKLKPYAKLKSLAEVVALAATRSDRKMSPGTVRVYTHTLASFFNWSIRKGLAVNNPATRLAPAKGAAEVSRRPFNVEEMNAIVAGLPAWSENGRRAGRLWAPLIALFSGMRMGEIVSLNVEDVAVVDGVDAFILRKSADKSLKTAGAERVVPVHPELARLGFPVANGLNLQAKAAGL